MTVNSLLVCIEMSLFSSTYFVYRVKYSCTLKNCDALKCFTFPFNMKISPTKQVPTTFSISLRQKTHNPISHNWKLEKLKIIQAKLIEQIMHSFNILWPLTQIMTSVSFSNTSLKVVNILRFSLQFRFFTNQSKETNINLS